MRVILFTGKGGVGKSTLAASTAVLAAQKGKRALLASSDLAHNLSDIFGVSVGSRKTAVNDRLSLLEVSILEEIREHWAPVQVYLSSILSYLGVDSVVAEEVALLPGVEEIFLLARILREVESGEHDLVVVDCAPTASALRMLTFSDSSSNKLKGILDVERKILKILRPFGRRVKGLKELLPEDEFYETIGQVIKNIGRLGDLLKDPKIASTRLVLNPDPIALAETKRSFAYLSLFGFPVDGILVNKVLPKQLSKGYFEDLYKEQQKYLRAINRSFLDCPILTLGHQSHTPEGLDALEALGREMYGRRQPDGLLAHPRMVEYKKRKKGILMSISAPNLDKESLDIGRKDNELILSWGESSRVLQLPDTLADADIESATYEDQRLKIAFAGSK